MSEDVKEAIATLARAIMQLAHEGDIPLDDDIWKALVALTQGIDQ